LKDNQLFLISIGKVQKEISVNLETELPEISIRGVISLCFANNLIEEVIAAEYLSDIGKSIENPLFINI